MRESDIRAVVLFFYLLFIDEKQVREFSHQALSRFRNHLIDKKLEEDALTLLKIMHAVCEKNREAFRTNALQTQTSFLKLPPNVDLAAWLELRKVSQLDELAAVVCAKVLDFPSGMIAAAIDASAGTVRHRLAHTLRRLGGLRTLRAV